MRGPYPIPTHKKTKSIYIPIRPYPVGGLQTNRGQHQGVEIHYTFNLFYNGIKSSQEFQLVGKFPSEQVTGLINSHPFFSINKEYLPFNEIFFLYIRIYKVIII